LERVSLTPDSPYFRVFLGLFVRVAEGTESPFFVGVAGVLGPGRIG